MKKERPKEFYYTNEQMVKDLIALLPLKENDYVLDAGSGKNKVWFNNLPNFCQKDECEIDEGYDFHQEGNKYDWIIGNPPFHESWLFFQKASELANKGIAFLINNLAFNSWTPKRFQDFADKGFYLQHIRIVADKRWFGRYYYLIFGREDKKLLSWELKTY